MRCHEFIQVKLQQTPQESYTQEKEAIAHCADQRRSRVTSRYLKKVSLDQSPDAWIVKGSIPSL